MNFETHYLSHYRVIPLQSFGSHIRHQLHRLGLRNNKFLNSYIPLKMSKEYMLLNTLKLKKPRFQRFLGQ